MFQTYYIFSRANKVSVTYILLIKKKSWNQGYCGAIFNGRLGNAYILNQFNNFVVSMQI